MARPMKEFTPNFKTPEEDFCKEEQNKVASNGMRGTIRDEFEDSEKADVSWETEQLAKSYGIYLAFNRAKTGRQKDWMYMIRINLPGGGVVTKEQWQVLDDLSEKFTAGPETKPSIRLTTRQNVQYHWVKKESLKEIVQRTAECGLFTINGCGDNARNTMACPLSKFSTTFNGNALAQRIASYFRLPTAPYIQIFEIDPNYLRQPPTENGDKKFQYGKNLLNRKFKIGISSVIRDSKTGLLVPDNCVEMRTNDLGIAPIIDGERVNGYQIYVGGGQGEKWGQPGLATLSRPVCRTDDENLMNVLDSVVAVHQEWGDRQNRQWARVKYLMKAKGVQWYKKQMEDRLGFALDPADEKMDIGPRLMHHGWSEQESNGLLSYGAYIENGRIIDDSPNGNLKTMVRELLEKYPTELLVTANQDLIFSNIPKEAKEDFQADFESYGAHTRNGKPFSILRKVSGACVGRDTCRLTYTDSEKFEPELIDSLEELGWGDMKESIGITGCERQCFRPGTKTIGLIGSGLDRYQLKLLGSEDGHHQGVPLVNKDKTALYLRSVPRDKVPILIDTLFKHYVANREEGEAMGYFHNRIGLDSIIEHLRENPATSELMEKPTPLKAYMEN